MGSGTHWAQAGQTQVKMTRTSECLLPSTIAVQHGIIKYFCHDTANYLAADLVLKSLTATSKQYPSSLLTFSKLENMSCFRNLCTSKRQKEAIPSDETPPARPTTPRHQGLSRHDSTTQKAASSQSSSPKLSSSIESVFGEGKKSEPLTEPLPPRSNDIDKEASLGIDFSTAFGGADPSVANDKSKILTGTGTSESHSAIFGLTPDGQVESEAGYGSPKPKPAHLTGSEGAAPADAVPETSGRGSMSVPEVRVTLVADGSGRGGTSVQENGISHANNNTSDTESSTSWAAANSSAGTEGTSSVGDGASGDVGASS
jgi:hypothetical protein